MIHELTFAGKSSREFGVIISGAKTFGSGQRDVESVSIPGRNGDLILDNGRYKNVTVTYEAYIPRNFRENFDAFNSWLMSQSSYARLEDSYQPDIYRMAHFSVGLQAEPVIRLDTGSFEITFDCKPQKFLKSGEMPITYTGSGSVFNPTLFEAKPLVRCYGSSGVLRLNRIRMAITGCSEYVDIDCELMECYEGDDSLNSTTTLTNGEFPYLSAGENPVRFTGFTSVVIYPRWWRI